MLGHQRTATQSDKREHDPLYGSFILSRKKRMKALTFLGAATCRGENVSAYNVSGFIIFLLTFSTTYDTKKKKKKIYPLKL